MSKVNVLAFQEQYGTISFYKYWNDILKFWGFCSAGAGGGGVYYS